MNWPAILAVILKYYVVVQCAIVNNKIRLQVHNIKTI